MDPTDYRRTVWQGIEVHLPAAWELIRYGSDYRRGVCLFADEFAERFQLAWQREMDRPDLDRLMSDIKAKELTTPTAEGGGLAPTCALWPAFGPWRGVTARQGDAVRTRAVCYRAEERLLLETAAFWNRTPEIETEHAILGSIRVHAREDWRPWEAFGIRAEVSTALGLTACRCVPADAELTFRGPRPRPWASVRRMGFVRAWLREPVADWLKAKLPEGWKLLSADASEIAAGHPSARMTAAARRGLLGLAASGHARRQELAVLCPSEQRLYHVIQEFDQDPAPALLKISCACGKSLLPD